MITYIKELFTKHPKEVNETYASHFKNAAKLSVRLGLAAPMQLLHAIFPFICPPLNSNVDSLIEYLKSMHPDERKACNEEQK
tara:strand:- start:934 stop:1179 length:246 start_codon:yes stop_codon:yes gene_type:complete